MKLTIVYDNETTKEGVKANWGFSCFVETEKTKLLFDTGAKGDILLDNMRSLGIAPDTVDEVFISHDHWDHTGGLNDLLEAAGEKRPRIYRPNFSREPQEFRDGLITTGAMTGGVIEEQSLIIRNKIGLVVLVGCSHPGLDRIIRVALEFGNIHALLGGFHGFDRFDVLEKIPLVLPFHCTKHKEKILELYPSTTSRCGAGKVIDI